MKHIDEQQLNDYVDGVLEGAARQAVEAHATSCERCSRELERAAALVAELESLPTEARPTKDLWDGIAERTTRRITVTSIDSARARRGRSLTVTLPQAAAAAIATAIIAGGSVWLALRSDVRGTDPELASPATVSFVNRPMGLTPYDDIVADLTDQLNAMSGDLDTVTVRVIRENLEVIDVAIDEINQALAQDPTDEFLNAYLARAMRRKVEVLRRASTLASRT